jgi:hypothetical protein
MNLPTLHISADPHASLLPKSEISQHQLIKRGIWAYFILLIVEGALRKWFLPGLSAPLLIVRDPVAFLLLFKAAKDGIIRPNIYMSSAILIGIAGLFTAIFLGHGNLAVALFGARILLIHFPLIFVIGTVFNREDVIKMGKTLVWISIPMALLIAIQFYSPQSAWVNRGIGGNTDGAGFSGALGFLRPPGTFSFTNGNALFFSFAGGFIIYFWLTPNNINRIVLFAATLSLLAAIPLSISRALFFSLAISLAFAFLAILRNPRLMSRVLVFAMFAFASFMILVNTGFFNTSVEAFMSRFENANEAEGGVSGVIGGRFLGGMLTGLSSSHQTPLWGYGLGMGTNAGAMMLTGNNSQFLISEEEWGRLIGELGPLLGILIILIRLALCVKMAFASYRRIAAGDLLPWMLLSFGIINIPQGQWAQPTSLGFSTLVAGLIIAAFNTQKEKAG